MIAYNKSKRKLSLQRVPTPLLLILFIIPLLGSLILDIGGKSLGEYFAYFILGYFLLSNESVLQKIDKYRFPLFIISILCMIAILLGWYGVIGKIPDIAYDIFSRFYAWVMILCLLGMGRHYLNFRNKVTDYFSDSSFPIYIFHQTWIIVIAYYIFTLTDNVLIQIALIMLLSILATFVSYELCKRINVTRFLFGIKSPYSK